MNSSPYRKLNASAHKITLDLGQGTMSTRVVSDNQIQLKFRTKDFEGEYFHYTGDLFFIYKSGHLMRLTCQNTMPARQRPDAALYIQPPILEMTVAPHTTAKLA